MNSQKKILFTKDFKSSNLKKTLVRPSKPFRRSNISKDNSRVSQSKAMFLDSDESETSSPEIILEPPNVNPSMPSSFDNSNKLDVDFMFEKPGPVSCQISGIYNTAEDRHKLLDDLDNCCATYNETLRLDRPSLAGTCLDMCPEKERYWKEKNDSISVFEKDENDVYDQRRAVKDYERCSADQKEPPSHELRSTEVLDRTMNYLINNVFDINLEKVSWRQWYTFLNNRTRSIRKDISQQNLCNETVIRIVETITRFHIFCAERLCEESKDNFENRFNEESLKNCLQSLKDMYGDMKRYSCRNEAEFRSYMMMMNLDKGDVLDDVQKLPVEVFRSDEVRFAIRLYEAVNTNNYVRFFRLIESADFMASCLLHRFILPMRRRAFTVVNKAYVANKSGENQVPLVYFNKILGFENLEEAGKFCQGLGLSYLSENVISLNGSALNTTMDDFIRRSHKLVENKIGHHKLSRILIRDTEDFTDTSCELEPCKMISFNERGRYIGSMKFLANKSTAALDARQGSSKDNFDLSDSDYIAKPEKTVESKKTHDENKNIMIDLTGDVPHVTKNTVAPAHSTLFSQMVGSSSIFQNIQSIFKAPQPSNNAALELFSQQPSNKKGENPFASRFVPSEPSDQSPDSKKISFYLPQKKTSVSGESSHTEEDIPNLSPEDFDNFADDINSGIIQDLTKDFCEKYVELEKAKTVESIRVEREIIRDVLTEVAMEARYCAQQEIKISVSKDYFSSLMCEVMKELCQATQLSCRKNQLSADKRIDTLKRNHFKYWWQYSRTSIRDRRSLAKLPACPRMADDFTVCQDFRGKVRKISTEGFVCSDVYGTRHPIIARLEQDSVLTAALPRVIAKRDSVVQTNLSYADITKVRVDIFLWKCVQERFINVLACHRSVLEMAKEVDPAPEILISDYNSLIDQLNSITESKARACVATLMKLPPLSLSNQPMPKWLEYVDHIFSKLEIPHHDRSPVLHEIHSTLQCLDNSQELPELSYHHLRLFPWMKIVKIAVLNKLSLAGQFAHLDMEMTTSDKVQLTRLQLENPAHGLSIERCVQQCDIHRRKYTPVVAKSPGIQRPRRLSAYRDLLNKVADLEMKIDQCK